MVNVAMTYRSTGAAASCTHCSSLQNRNKGITGFWELAGQTPAPVPAESFKDVLMAPTLIGMFHPASRRGLDGLHHRKRPSPREPGHPRFGIVRKLPKNPLIGTQPGFRLSHDAHAGLQHPRRQHFLQRNGGSSLHKIARGLRHLP